MQRVGTALCEIGPKAIAAHVLHLVLVGQRRDGALRILLGQLFPQEYEIGEAPADVELGALERLEVGLAVRISWRVREGWVGGSATNLGGDEVGHICIFGARQLFRRCIDRGFEATLAEVLHCGNGC